MQSKMLKQASFERTLHTYLLQIQNLVDQKTVLPEIFFWILCFNDFFLCFYTLRVLPFIRFEILTSIRVCVHMFLNPAYQRKYYNCVIDHSNYART